MNQDFLTRYKTPIVIFFYLYITSIATTVVASPDLKSILLMVIIPLLLPLALLLYFRFKKK